jgi:hypothetical protein
MHDGRASLQRALHLISFDPVISAIAASISDADIQRIARDVATADPFNERNHLRAALDLVAPERALDEAQAIEHQLWCACRESRWRSGALGRDLPLRVSNPHHLHETAGHPTIVIAPMTLRLGDASSTARRVFDGRSVIFYGEEVDSGSLGAGFDAAHVAGDGLAGVRRIESVLRSGGVLCTYADFAYVGHATREMSLFGRPRPVASGLLTLAVRYGAMLLPMVALREGDGIHAVIQEPIRLEGGGARLRGDDKQLAMDTVARAIAESLEDSIRRAPQQWLLLATLTFEAPQMAPTS